MEIPLTEEEIYAELEEYSKHMAHNPTPKGKYNRAYRITLVLQDRGYVEPFWKDIGLYTITEKGKEALKNLERQRG